MCHHAWDKACVGSLRLHLDPEPHFREPCQPEPWGECVCGGLKGLLPCWKCQADGTLWRAWPTARGLWHSHRFVWPVEAIERRSRCRCQGGQHPYCPGDAHRHRAALPLLPVVAAHWQPVCAAAPWGWVRWVRGKLLAILLLWWEVSLQLTWHLWHCQSVFRKHKTVVLNQAERPSPSQGFWKNVELCCTVPTTTSPLFWSRCRRAALTTEHLLGVRLCFDDLHFLTLETHRFPLVSE